MTVPVTRTNYRPEELRDLAKRCGNGAQARRLRALILEGHSRQDAAEAQNMDQQTLRDWVHRYNEFGGLNDRPKSGRKVFLDKGQLYQTYYLTTCFVGVAVAQSRFTIDAISVGESHSQSQPFRQASRTSATSGVDLFLPNSLFLLPISPSSGVRRFVRGSSRHAGSKRSDRINDGEDILTSCSSAPVSCAG